MRALSPPFFIAVLSNSNGCRPVQISIERIWVSQLLLYCCVLMKQEGARFLRLPSVEEEGCRKREARGPLTTRKKRANPITNRHALPKTNWFPLLHSHNHGLLFPGRFPFQSLVFLSLRKKRGAASMSRGFGFGWWWNLAHSNASVGTASL